MATIPELRVRILQIVDELLEIEKEMYRRKPIRKTKPKSKRVPKSVIRSLARLHPNASEMDLAEALKVNIGRVSEALHGKRT